MKNNFYAYLSRLKHIKRWGLMRNTIEENVAEHSFNVAIITHALCIIKNQFFDGDMPVEKAVLAALYHETAEAITGDLPTPVKYFDEDINQAYKKIEKHAEKTMIAMLPEDMAIEISPFVLGQVDDNVKKTVKAADKLCAYIKCIEEKKSGNTEFEKASETIRKTLEELDMPEVNYFMQHFIPAYHLTLDELN